VVVFGICATVIVLVGVKSVLIVDI
jgi:hypothetical protein